MSVTVHTDGDGPFAAHRVISYCESDQDLAESDPYYRWPSKLGPPLKWVREMSKEDIKATLLLWELDAAGGT